jgi:hypothetical protein
MLVRNQATVRLWDATRQERKHKHSNAHYTPQSVASKILRSNTTEREVNMATQDGRLNRPVSDCTPEESLVEIARHKDYIRYARINPNTRVDYQMKMIGQHLANIIEKSMGYDE